MEGLQFTENAVNLTSPTLLSLYFRMQVLDDLGDRSELEMWEQYFKEIDTDGSGAIDFEEFLAV